MSKFAFLFTGQGAQAVGMLNGFAGNPVVEQTVAEASEALGQDLGKLIAEGPKEDLDLTTNTQPVMLTAAVAVYRAWIAAGGPKPAVVAGHSLGEYSALVAAGVIDFKDAVPLVRFRAQSMQDAVPVGQGGMAVILGLQADAVREVCAEAAEQGRGRRSRQLQRADPDRDRRPYRRGRARLRHRQGQGRQARHEAGGVGAVPLFAAEARLGPPARLHGRPELSTPRRST
jgi:malonyl CoA-acyl carrier protein transacylase